MNTTRRFVSYCENASNSPLNYTQFVYPRVNPIRKDAAVMTHESEVVDVWQDKSRSRR